MRATGSRTRTDSVLILQAFNGVVFPLCIPLIASLESLDGVVFPVSVGFIGTLEALDGLIGLDLPLLCIVAFFGHQSIFFVGLDFTCGPEIDLELPGVVIVSIVRVGGVHGLRGK